LPWPVANSRTDAAMITSLSYPFPPGNTRVRFRQAELYINEKSGPEPRGMFGESSAGRGKSKAAYSRPFYAMRAINRSVAELHGRTAGGRYPS
jgi:hypothetical protein